MSVLRIQYLYLLLLLVATSCKPKPGKDSSLTENLSDATQTGSLLERYVATPDTTFKYELRDSVVGDGHVTYFLYMESQRWMTEKEVKNPIWWHWLSITVPDEVVSDIGLLWIGGGSRSNKLPKETWAPLVDIAKYTKTVTAGLHNVPNQETVFVGDDYGPRVEDELIAYGWRQFLERGAKDEDAIWLARLPMTKSAVRAMDAVSGYCNDELGKSVNKFTVFGGSKRGWTTWTTAVVDERVVAIAPIVIDMLNVVPSFENHWQAYGFWAPAVGNYVEEGIMEWQQTEEYKKLMSITEPYSYRERLTLPKYIVNASGDQFFLPDSWKYYWHDLSGEARLRYVPNADHSLSGSDAMFGFTAFYKSVVDGTPRPDFDWILEDGKLLLETYPDSKPDSIYLWQAYNPSARDFRTETFGRKWEKEIIPISAEGKYELSIIAPDKGWKAFYAEMVFPGSGSIPFKFSTGVFITPDSLAYPPYEPKKPPM